MEVTGTSDAYQRARTLRRAMTKPERLLWWALRGEKTGFHFRRQHAAGPYVLDFYCEKARLCVEVDGASHDMTVPHDRARDLMLQRQWGVATLRIGAGDVLGNLSGVTQRIAEVAGARVGDTPPSACG